MSYTDRKITQAEINAHHVQGATDYLIGNAQQNKAVFDNLPEFIAGKFNDLIDEIAGQHGDEIRVAVDEWLAEHPEVTTTVQDNSLTTAKYVDGSVTPAKLDRTYTTPNDLLEVNANLTTEINVLDARMDEFASLPEGSTSGNAELVDIRVGVDGETYQSAGGAVRGQAADLKNDLTQAKYNLVNYDRNGILTIAPFSSWTTGGLSQGQPTKPSGVGAKCRLVSVDAITFDEDTLLTIESGRRMSAHLLNSDGTFKSDLGWQTGGIVIPANTPFRVLISATASTSDEEYALTADESYTRFITLYSCKKHEKNELDELIQKYVGTVVPCVLSDGSVPNPRNTEGVATDFIPCQYGDLVEIFPVRELSDSNCVYKYTYAIFDSSKAYLINQTTGSEENKKVSISFENAAYIRFAIWEYNTSTSANNALRIKNYPERPFVLINNSDSFTNIESKIFNSAPYKTEFDWQAPVYNYCKGLNGRSDVENFAFFTDPHIAGTDDSDRNTENFKEYLKKVQKVYNSSPCDFIMSGGDWLNWYATVDEACYRLGYIDALMKSMLHDSHLVVGNHDTNYQGKLTPSSENYTGRLSDATMATLWARDTNTRKNYYSFDGTTAKCYVLDTGIEHSDMIDYDWEQVDWLADQLVRDDPQRAIIFLHIMLTSGYVQTNASHFGYIVEAYNLHTTATFAGRTYDFTSCTGHVDFWVAGHAHQDVIGTEAGIPYVITTTNNLYSDDPVVDLFSVDYTNRVVSITRAGNGDDRTFEF